MVDTTLLVLEGMGVPLYSARGIVQSLEPIEAASDLKRTINGALKDLSIGQFQKYRSSINCNDQQSPALDGIWPGAQITVHCISELSYEFGGSPQRTEISGSSRQEGDFVFYRPILVMRVTSFNQRTDEYGAQTSWSMTLEEI